MAYWWVSHNKTHRQEREGGFLWAPKVAEDGSTRTYWTNMTLVQPGDLVFSYAQQRIGAIGVVTSAVYDAPLPEAFEADWDDDGWKVDVSFKMLDNRLELVTFVDELRPYLPQRNSPITRDGTGAQGYLFSVPPRAGRLISNLLDAGEIDQLLANALSESGSDETTREALVKARVGQGRWRRELMRFWSGRCAVTGLTVDTLLRASHIKPWRDSDNRERLDVHNGLLLSPAYDAAFDAGLISFDAEGAIMISPHFPANDLVNAGVSADARLSRQVEAQSEYLAYHRESVFVAA